MISVQSSTDPQEIARSMRLAIFEMLTQKGGGHYGGCFSCVELLVSIYFRELEEGDTFVLSKAHAGVAHYAVLAARGLIDPSLLETYGLENTRLGVHGEVAHLPAVGYSCGSLGHGLSYGAGLALGLRKKRGTSKVYVLIGDGESQEGSVWEAAMFAAHHKLSNLIAITDYNRKQSSGRIENILDLGNLTEKWRSFGWSVQEIDGHNFDSIENGFSQTSENLNKPKMIIANTIKGKGLDILENKEECHYDRLTAAQVCHARMQLS